MQPPVPYEDAPLCSIPTGPDAGKVSADNEGTITARTAMPSRILKLTGYINASGTVSYAKKPVDEKNKISEIFDWATP